MAKQTIYHFDRKTREYIGASTLAKRDHVLAPAFSTRMAPPAAQPFTAFILSATGKKWVPVSDFRGVVYDAASGARQQHHTLGKLPPTLTSVGPNNIDIERWDGTAWVVDAAKLAAHKIAQLALDYQAAMDADVAYAGSMFQSDARSISALSEVLTALANGWVLPNGFAWIDAANVPHPADVVFLKGLALILADHKSALFSRLQTAKQAIVAAKTVAAINKIKL